MRVVLWMSTREYQLLLYYDLYGLSGGSVEKLLGEGAGCEFAGCQVSLLSGRYRTLQDTRTPAHFRSQLASSLPHQHQPASSSHHQTTSYSNLFAIYPYLFPPPSPSPLTSDLPVAAKKSSSTSAAKTPPKLLKTSATATKPARFWTV